MARVINPWLWRVLLVNLILEIGIVVTGGLVRLTGSGLGCPTWPQCVPGSFIPVPHQEQGFHKLIEFGNRTLTSVVGIAALLVIVAIWRWAPNRRTCVGSRSCHWLASCCRRSSAASRS